MRDLGFRFALQAVTDLDMDFDSLKTKGFSFVKLDADVFLEGMPAPGGPLPAADICRHLAELGLTLIVGGIDDETKLARIFGFGALLGQGQMFGGPRPVKAEALGSHPAAA
jgi:cyclic-di-GMP phosphodiesterase TipF (flagellum assembly factor)